MLSEALCARPKKGVFQHSGAVSTEGSASRNLNIHINPLAILLKCRLAFSWSRRGPRASIPDKLPGDADAAFRGPHLDSPSS